MGVLYEFIYRLIETRVVFEYATTTFIAYIISRLIETRVVFEFGWEIFIWLIISRLIETRVVFELKLGSGTPEPEEMINRNKSCI